MKDKYTFGNFLVDLFLTVITGGIWALWKIAKWMFNSKD